MVNSERRTVNGCNSNLFRIAVDSIWCSPFPFTDHRLPFT
jgi:hypothetical protein